MDKNKAGNGGEIILHFLIVDKPFSRFMNERAFKNLFDREKNRGFFEGVADIKCYGAMLFGLISKCFGCVYVQRESKSPNFKGVAGAVAERVKEAHQNKSALPK
ncbi:uncharacterized protein [Pyrus communis]|uniref:uncharacterized protein n=1 Tax=Pyrus communis TaxID=23211 RepID=UPI0035BF24F7